MRTKRTIVLKEAKISLQRGVTASAKEGKPISAKYEVEDGKLQLSVYTMKGATFSEVIVDHKTGKVAKAEPITKADDRKGAGRGDGEGKAVTQGRRRSREGEQGVPRRQGHAGDEG